MTGGNETILVVEADPQQRTELVRLLEGEGYSVPSYSTIFEAIAYLREGDAPRVILVGCSVPTLNPDDLFAEIRGNVYLAWIPVVLIADSTVDLLSLLGESRPYSVLDRSASTEKLLEVLRLAVVLRPAPK